VRRGDLEKRELAVHDLADRGKVQSQFAQSPHEVQACDGVDAVEAVAGRAAVKAHTVGEVMTREVIQAYRQTKFRDLVRLLNRRNRSRRVAMPMSRPSSSTTGSRSMW
jgi:hypothetical protein